MYLRKCRSVLWAFFAPQSIQAKGKYPGHTTSLLLLKW